MLDLYISKTLANRRPFLFQHHQQSVKALRVKYYYLCLTNGHRELSKNTIRLCCLSLFYIYKPCAYPCTNKQISIKTAKTANFILEQIWSLFRCAHVLNTDNLTWGVAPAIYFIYNLPMGTGRLVPPCGFRGKIYKHQYKFPRDKAYRREFIGRFWGVCCLQPRSMFLIRWQSIRFPKIWQCIPMVSY